MQPEYVTAHLASGDFPAIVTSNNPDGTKNLCVFTNTDCVFRMSVGKYVAEVDDTDDDKVGYWSVG